MPSLFAARPAAGPRPLGTGLVAGALTQGLAAAWTMQEGGGTLLSDASGQLGPGTISGPTWTASPLGPALAFSASADKAVVSSTGVLWGSPETTIAAWVQMTSLPSATCAIYSEEKSVGTVYTLYLNSANQVAAQIDKSNAVFVSATDPIALSAGPVHLVGATFSASAGLISLYVDGALRTTSVWDGTFVSGTITGADIGALPANGTGLQWRGSIAQVLAYKRTLGAAEFRLLAQAPDALWAPPPPPWLLNALTASGVQPGGDAPHRALALGAVYRM